MVEYLNQFFDVLSLYIKFLFSLQFLPSVSVGSIFLVATFLWIIVTTLWVRR